MKFLILGAIILVHLVVLGFLLGPCSPERGGVAPQPETGQDGSAPAGSGQAAALPGDVEPAASSLTFGPRFYSESLAVLPPELAAAAQECAVGIVVDWSARTVLWKKQDEKAVPIASLTKMMTVLMLMETLEKDPALTLQTPVQVTKESSLVGGRQVWLDSHETFTLDELLKCTLIFSANDAAYLIGQFLAGGDCTTFVSRMNSHARELGLQHFTFHNPNGLPEGPQELENTGCARELSYLAGRLLDYPAVLKWSQTKNETLASPRRKPATMLTSTNKLLGTVPGVNGMKTGFTDDAGWCMAATCTRGGRTVIVVVTGCKEVNTANGLVGRNALVASLVNWAYDQN